MKIHEGGHSQPGFERLEDPDPEQEAIIQALAPKNLDFQLADMLYKFFSQFARQDPPAPPRGP